MEETSAEIHEVGILKTLLWDVVIGTPSQS